MDRPIIFTGPMVRALLEGRKTQTRRVLKIPDGWHFEGINIHEQWLFYPDGDCSNAADDARMEAMYGEWDGLMKPKYQPGDLLWVRETWGAVLPGEKNVPLEECNIEYRADLPDGSTDYPGEWPAEEARGNEDAPKWRSPIYMPRWVSRINLKVGATRIERLQEISEEDARAEGVDPPDMKKYPGIIQKFARIWNSIHGPGAWESNPWVMALRFNIAKEGEACLATL